MLNTNPTPKIPEDLDPAMPVGPAESTESKTTVAEGESEKRPFVLTRRATDVGGKDKTNRILFGAAALLVLVIAFFGLLSTKGSKKAKNAAQASKPNLGRVVTPSAPGQVVPADKMAAPQSDTKTGSLEAGDIEKTKAVTASAGRQPMARSDAKRNLGEVEDFRRPNTDSEHMQSWTPPPPVTSAPPSTEGRAEQEAYSKPSLVFVAHQDPGEALSNLPRIPVVPNLGLESGYHVAARLESMASSALHAPVTAIVEYNYERDGQVLIPAGARAVGKVTQADASGIMNIDFDSLELSENQSVPISAIAATTSLQAIKGDVTGKHVGRSILVRSVAGLGEAGAMLVGQGNVNGAYSESDMIRERAAENIGNAGDAQVMSMMTTQHIVVSVPARTEIYLIFTKPLKTMPPTSHNATAATAQEQTHGSQ